MTASSPSPPLSVPIVPREGRSGFGRRRREFVLAGGLLLVFGLVFAWALGSSVIRQIRAGGFAPVPAIVVESRIVERGARPRRFVPHIVYSYRIDGLEHTTDRYNFAGESWRERAPVRAILARYPVGATVTAYVDPADPADAVLENAPPEKAWMGALILVVYVGFALLVVRHGWKRRA